MSLVVPKEINYSPKNVLPAGTKNTQFVVSPANGSTFAAGSIIYFDLPNVGYLVPETMYLRYKLNYTQGATATNIKGTPAYTPFSRLDTLIGAQIVESIQSYNLIANMLVNTKMSYAQKCGAGYMLGYLDGANALGSLNTNSRVVPANAGAQSIPLAAPLGCILSNAENLVPLGMMPSVRLQLTVDSAANMFINTTSITNVSLSNLELVFDDITFGDDVDAVVRAQADANGIITLKSQSFVCSSQSVATGTTGQQEYVFNQRLSSIKCAVASFSKATLNTFLDSVDITSNNGDYQFVIGGVNYPQRPLSTLNNKAGIFAELIQIWSPAHDLFSAPSAITPQAFAFISNDNTTALSPAQFFVGTNLERLSGSALLTGISSQLSPISLRVNIGTATGEAHTIYLILSYDALLQIDVNNRMCSVKQ